MKGQGMKSLLAVMGDGDAASMLETTLTVAQRFGSHIVAFHASLNDLAGGGGGDIGDATSAQLERTMQRQDEVRRTSARRAFDSFVASHGIAESDEPSPLGPTAEWREAAGWQNAFIGSLGRAFDLIVVQRPAKLASLAEATLEEAIFESGRPVLMVPPVASPTLGERIVVAWNGGTETALTIAHAMPFLLRARAVDVVSVTSGLVPGPSGHEVAQTLTRHGIAAIARHADTKADAGTVWLEECRAMRADLLIKGAYTKRRLRQMIFGGPTRQIILKAEVPVVLAH
jgi:nucleotide-binding universal stress UspA family protein